MPADRPPIKPVCVWGLGIIGFVFPVFVAGKTAKAPFFELPGAGWNRRTCRNAQIAGHLVQLRPLAAQHAHPLSAGAEAELNTVGLILQCKKSRGIGRMSHSSKLYRKNESYTPNASVRKQA